MPVEFEGGPIDGVKKSDEASTDSEYWLIGRKAPFAVYVRRDKPGGGICYKFDRYCNDQEAVELKAKYRTEETGGMSSGQGY
jgi:hypothetical protein